MSYPENFEVPKEWLLNAAGKNMKAVSCHMCGRRVIFPEGPSEVWAHYVALYGVQAKHPALWPASAPDLTIEFWKTVRNRNRKLKVECGTSIAAVRPLMEAPSESEGHCTVANLPRL